MAHGHTPPPALVISMLAPSLALAGPGAGPSGSRDSLWRTQNPALSKPPVRSPARAPLSALLSARFRLAMVDGKPVIDATFRTATFSDGLAMIPLVGGAVTVESQKPLDARILIQEEMLCQAQEKAGTQAP